MCGTEGKLEILNTNYRLDVEQGKLNLEPPEFISKLVRWAVACVASVPVRTKSYVSRE